MKLRRRKEPTPPPPGPVQADESKCFGCNKSIHDRIPRGTAIADWPKGKDRAEVELGPGAKVWVCGNGRYSGYYGIAYPSGPCRRRAVFKARVCPGCGGGPHLAWLIESEDGYHRAAGQHPGYCSVIPGGICRTCEEKLADYASLAETERDVKWYRVNPAQLSRKVRAHPDGFGRLLLRAIAGEGRVGYPKDAGYPDNDKSGEPFELIDGRPNGISYTTSDRGLDYETLVQLTADQARAVRALGEAWGHLLELERAEGFEHGASALRRLADGETSVHEWDDRNHKRETKLVHLRAKAARLEAGQVVTFTDVELELARRSSYSRDGIRIIDPAAGELPRWCHGDEDAECHWPRCKHDGTCQDPDASA